MKEKVTIESRQKWKWSVNKGDDVLRGWMEHTRVGPAWGLKASMTPEHRNSQSHCGLLSLVVISEQLVNARHPIRSCE